MCRNALYIIYSNGVCVRNDGVLGKFPASGHLLYLWRLVSYDNILVCNFRRMKFANFFFTGLSDIFLY